MDQQPVSLNTVGGGAAVELFQESLDRVLANIADPNTDAEAKREVKLTFSFKPDEERTTVGVTIKAESKLAAIKPVATVVFAGKLAGKHVAVEHNPKQLQMAWDEASKPRQIRTVAEFQASQDPGDGEEG